jgi:Fur family ferric uptake transcriptional regulator
MKHHHTQDWTLKLRTVGLKATPIRLQLLQVMSKGHQMLSIHEIHKLLGKNKADPVTIYRCIRKFEQSGLVDSVALGDGVIRYEIRDSDQDHSHHHHLICRICNVAILIKDCLVTKIPKFVQTLGFSDVSHRLDFLGVCPGCQGVSRKSA